LDCVNNKRNGTKIIFNLFDNHLTEHHTDLANDLNQSSIENVLNQITEDDLNCMETAYCKWVARKISLNGAQFFDEVILKHQKFYMWVYYLGSKEEAKNYSCAIKVYGGPDNEEFSYIGPPRSLDESLEEVIAANCGLMLNLDQAKRIVSEEKMKYSIKIFSSKEETKDEDVESGVKNHCFHEWGRKKSRVAKATSGFWSPHK
jgi:hypothetical protein